MGRVAEGGRLISSTTRIMIQYETNDMNSIELKSFQCESGFPQKWQGRTFLPGAYFGVQGRTYNRTMVLMYFGSLLLPQVYIQYIPGTYCHYFLVIAYTRRQIGNEEIQNPAASLRRLSQITSVVLPSKLVLQSMGMG